MVASAYNFVKKNIVSNFLITFNLLGIFLIFAHTSLLGNLSDITTWLHNFFEIIRNFYYRFICDEI